jgi:hypothetical protein
VAGRERGFCLGGFSGARVLRSNEETAFACMEYIGGLYIADCLDFAHQSATG